MKLHLDTHVALWLVAGHRRLRTVQSELKRSSLFVSSIVVLEMELLREIGRIRSPVSEVWDILTTDYGVAEAEGSLLQIAAQARQLAWTRDPFDRLIVAHALASNAELFTADETILKNCSRARGC